MKNMMSCFKEGEEGVMELISRQLLDLWNRYKPTIAVDAIEYDRELKKLLGTNLAEVGTDAVSRQAALDAIRDMQAFEDDNGQPYLYLYDVMATFTDEEELPPIQPEIVRCKDCKYWNKGSCECPEHAVNCQDYYVGDIETEAEHFCGYADRREVTT